ncbi:hypothetical protein BJP08_04180 [Corynebacterium sp. NML140438]|uniref:DUF4439 domain-containing protein n=1 Tax=Corynebacterium sp. NML140438 TaxID=1906334 RepID=UPI0008FB1553|nr:DUF4439 domain-containing protein [Corynebacterium sp. NML140438]OIR42508.1 hypothetical protein BJP08_04180 [Corynebacterium sp. NML140438]
MKKLLVAVLAVPLGLSLASCDLLDVVGPRPDKSVLGLANQATADAQSLSEPALAELRSKQAQELYGEVTRLCGSIDAEVPRSCEFSADPRELAGASDAVQLRESAVQSLSTSLDKVPAESRDLVAAQAVDIVAATGPALDSESTVALQHKDDIAQASRALQTEYEFLYGIGLAKAFADAPLHARIATLEEAANERVAFLRSSLRDANSIPVAAAGYQLAHGEALADAADAESLVDALSAQLIHSWRSTVAQAHSAEWKEQSLMLAAQAQHA